MRSLTLTFLLLATGFILCPEAVAQQQGAPPLHERETPFARVHEAFLEAYNTGVRDSLRRFVAAHYSEAALDQIGADSRTDYLQSKYAQHGPLSFHHMGVVGSDSVAWMRGTVSNFWLGVKTTLTAQPPHKIKRQGMLLGGAPEEHPLVVDGPLPADSLAAVLDGYLDGMATKDLFSGIVLVAKNGHPLYERAVGWADVSSKTPNRLDTRFPLASITKSITAAVLRLRDQGRLALNDPLEEFVPEYPDTIATAVTVRDLLTHQSGIELDTFEGFNEAKLRASSLDEVLELHLTYLDTLRQEAPNRSFPLDKFDYTNEGYGLLGLIVERVSGQSYPDAVQELVLRPAGMRDTGFILPTHPVPHLATPQYSSLSRDTPPRVGAVRTETFWSYPEPAGGMYATAGDLNRFVQSLVDARLLDAETATQTQVSRFRPPPVTSAGYGFGFETGAVGERAVFGHGGTYGGVSTNVAHFPDTGHTIVVLSNYSFVGHGVFSYVRDLVTPASRPAAASSERE